VGWGEAGWVEALTRFEVSIVTEERCVEQRFHFFLKSIQTKHQNIMLAILFSNTH